jgi:hypothetical protein
MVVYTLAQSPETVIEVAGKDSAKARDKAMDQLVALMDDGKLPTTLADGFGPQQLIEVEDLPLQDSTQTEEANVIEAVQVLSQLATLKLKLQDSREEALAVRELVDLLFSPEPITQEQVDSLKDGFKTLKQFAQHNLKYRDARTQAEAARQVLDEALKP